MVIYPVVKVGSTVLGWPQGYQNLDSQEQPACLRGRMISFPFAEGMQHLLGNAPSFMAGMIRLVQW